MSEPSKTPSIETPSIEKVLANYRYLGGYIGTQNPQGLIGNYAEFRRGNLTNPEGSIKSKNVEFKVSPIASLPDGTYYVEKRTAPYRGEFSFTSKFFGDEEGETLSTKPDNAIAKFVLKDIQYCEMTNVKGVLEKLKEVKFRGVSLPEFFNENDMHLIIGVIWGTGTHETVNKDSPYVNYGEADHIVLGLRLMRYDYPLFYPAGLIYGFSPVFIPKISDEKFDEE